MTKSSLIQSSSLAASLYDFCHIKCGSLVHPRVWHLAHLCCSSSFSSSSSGPQPENRRQLFGLPLKNVFALDFPGDFFNISWIHEMHVRIICECLQDPGWLSYVESRKPQADDGFNHFPSHCTCTQGFAELHTICLSSVFWSTLLKGFLETGKVLE